MPSKSKDRKLYYMTGKGGEITGKGTDWEFQLIDSIGILSEVASFADAYGENIGTPKPKSIMLRTLVQGFPSIPAPFPNDMKGANRMFAYMVENDYIGILGEATPMIDDEDLTGLHREFDTDLPHIERMNQGDSQHPLRN